MVPAVKSGAEGAVSRPLEEREKPTGSAADPGGEAREERRLNGGDSAEGARVAQLERHEGCAAHTVPDADQILWEALRPQHLGDLIDMTTVPVVVVQRWPRRAVAREIEREEFHAILDEF